MRGVELPEHTEDFTADPVELFFDLAFVLAFSQLVSHLVHHPTWEGAGEAAILFLMVWLPWSQFTWSANAVSGNSRSVRAVFLVATTASVPMAASVTTAFDDGGVVFAASASVILLMGLALMAVVLDPTSPEFRSTIAYAIPNIVTVALFVVGSAVEDEARVVLWVAALVVAIGGTVSAGSSEWVIRSGHFAERHGLILIIALGEVIVAIGLPVIDRLQEGEGLATTTVLALIGSGLLAGLMWWSYFDRPGPAFEHKAEQLSGVEAGRFARDVYTYAHAPLIAGVLLVATALEEITLHPEDALHDEFRLIFLAGLGLYLAGVIIGVARSFAVFARERAVCALALAVLIAISGSWDGLYLLIAVDLVIFVALMFEHTRVERIAA